MDELYKLAEDVVGVYNREVLEAEEACVHLGKVINAVMNNLDIPIKPPKIIPENGEEEEEDDDEGSSASTYSTSNTKALSK